MGKLAFHSAPAAFDRRSFLGSAAGVALTACAASALDLLAGPASAKNWRGFVGCIKPRANGSALAQMISMLPEGIGVAPLFLNFVEGTREELQEQLRHLRAEHRLSRSQRCDLIDIEGAPPFMLLGPDGEAKLLRRLEGEVQDRHVHLLAEPGERAAGVEDQEILGVTAFKPDMNKTVRQVFRGLRHRCRRHGRDGRYVQVDRPTSPAEAIYSFIKKTFLQQTGADAIYILGSGFDACCGIDLR